MSFGNNKSERQHDVLQGEESLPAMRRRIVTESTGREYEAIATPANARMLSEVHAIVERRRQELAQAAGYEQQEIITTTPATVTDTTPSNAVAIDRWAEDDNVNQKRDYIEAIYRDVA